MSTTYLINTKRSNFEIKHDLQCRYIVPYLCPFVAGFKNNPFSEISPCIIEVKVHKRFLETINGRRLELCLSSDLLSQKKIEYLNHSSNTTWNNCELCLTEVEKCAFALRATVNIPYKPAKGEHVYLSESPKYKLSISYKKTIPSLPRSETEGLVNCLAEGNLPHPMQVASVKIMTNHACWKHMSRMIPIETLIQWNRIVKIQNCSACLKDQPCEFKKICLFEL